MSAMVSRIAITGGAGYVGSALVPALLDAGHEVTVIDLFLYGERVFGAHQDHPTLRRSRVDIRDEAALTAALAGADALIHLACISNDPSFELDPALGKSINYDAFPGLLRAVAAQGVKRLIYASSSSVYGVKEQADVREDDACEPLTDYSTFKLLCEELLAQADLGACEWVIVRPATVCGYATRLRLDLSVNILTIHALASKAITVFGGSQLRPNLHIRDMVRAYQLLLSAPADLIHRQVFNVGFQNLPIAEIAELVRRRVADPAVTITVKPTNDLRSYHVNSDRIRRVLGFTAQSTIEDAVDSLCAAYRAGRIPDALTDPRYYNLKRMQTVRLPVEAAGPRGA
jgi:nucleoside-diphosphate-sugar epimerase